MRRLTRALTVRRCDKNPNILGLYIYCLTVYSTEIRLIAILLRMAIIIDQVCNLYGSTSYAVAFL